MLDSMTGQYCDGDTDDTKKDQDVEGYPNKTCKKALSVFYATCKEKGLDYTQPMPKKVEEGKFTFLVDSLIITEGVAEGVYKAHGFALHPIITHHPGEPPRVYSAVKEELIKAAPTLKGKHLDIDHSDVPVNPDINIITDSKWNFEVEAVEFWAQIDDYLYELIQGGCPVSVSIDWLIPDQGGIKVVEVNGEIGIAPYGFEFGDPGLSILQQLTPGDPNAMIELLMESISRVQNNGDKKLRKQNENSEKPPKTPPEDLEEQGAEQPVEITPAVPKTVEEVKARITELAKRRAEISEKLYPEAELSDDERAALKAEQEVIWSEIAALEKALGDIIAAQVRGQLPEGYQIKVLHEPEDEDKEPPVEKSEKEKFIEQCMAGEDGKTEEQCETEWAEKQKPPESTPQESTDLVALQKEIVGLKAIVTELLARVDKLEKGQKDGNLAESLLKKSNEPSIKVTEAIKILEGLLPSRMVERSSMGMQRECQAIRGAILQLKEMLKSG